MESVVDKVESTALAKYRAALEKELAAGNTTEHSHRPALKTLLEALNTAVTATNEPQHITAVGGPDFRIVRNHVTTGYVECKDIGIDLDEVLKTDQLQRYLKSLHNLVLTNYLEFRWYVHGQCRMTVWLAQIQHKKVKPEKDGSEKTAELLNSFLKHKPEPVNNPKELAQHMARLAHLMGFIINNTLKAETAMGSLHAQLNAFCENLIPDLSFGQFADMYAQTIAYGLFAARCETDIGKDFTRYNANHLIPKTNPFLRKLFNYIAGPDLDVQLVGVVDDLTQILAHAEMEAILQGFGKSTGKDDPVVHFYETFLKEYDPKVKEMRGVYYTPLPVVSYIVRSIDYLLKTRFNKAQGLADDKALILDPAVGTATFLYTVINEIRQALAGQEGMWDGYVAEKLLPRLFGFELLMAPYAVAHLKLGLLLRETGYQFQNDQRLGIYLTNTLEEAFKKSEQLAGFNEYIVDEANAAAEIKKEKPIMVVLGNPPYSGHSANKGPWAKRLIEAYKTVDGKPLGEKNPKWLQDDYVKFLAFGQWRIGLTGQGILGFITNHSYLDNPTFRGMRQSFLNTFTDIYILNLHGSAKKKETDLDGGKDENVFDIQQGVSIGIFIKHQDETSPAKVYYGDVWGLREAKYQALTEMNIATTDWVELKPVSPFYFFIPQSEDIRAEYEYGWKINEVFPSNVMGIQTHRDHFVIDFEQQVLHERIEEFRLAQLSDAEVAEKFNLKNTDGWSVSNARKELAKDENWEKSLVQCLYRPFDVRSLFYHKALIDRPRLQIMQHILNGSKALLLPRGVGGSWQHASVTIYPPVDVAISAASREANQVFPLYLYPTEGEMQFEGGKRRSNLNPQFIATFSEKLGLKFVEDGKGDLKETFGPEDILNYAYAVFHSPTYRTRYAEFLRIEFPRLPLTSDKELFKSLVAKGAELVALHLMESPTLNKPITKYPVTGSNEVDKVAHDEKTQRVFINKEQYFEGVAPEVWNFHIGGYQVCQKWLKDRKGRTLTYGDLAHYQKVIVALKETIRLMTEIDELIPRWPVE